MLSGNKSLISDHSLTVFTAGLTAMVTRKPSMEPRERQETFHRASPGATATEPANNKR